MLKKIFAVGLVALAMSGAYANTLVKNITPENLLGSQVKSAITNPINIGSADTIYQVSNFQSNYLLLLTINAATKNVYPYGQTPDTMTVTCGSRTFPAVPGSSNTCQLGYNETAIIKIDSKNFKNGVNQANYVINYK